MDSLSNSEELDLELELEELSWGELYDYREFLSAEVEEFYNQCHDKQGHFCEGPDGPGRVRDKDISILPKRAPEYMKNILRRKIGAAQAKAKAKAETPAKVEAKTKTAEPAASKASTKETKSEGSGHHPASDYAYVPDPEKSSGWKLKLTSKPGGKPDAKTVGAAVAALGKGFRGHVVQIPAEDRPKVIAKVRAAWLKANPDKTRKDLPEILKNKKG
jgi:hypothetical protein